MPDPCRGTRPPWMALAGGVATVALALLGPGPAHANVSDAVPPPPQTPPAAQTPARDGEPAFDRPVAYVGIGGTFAHQNFSTPGTQDDSGSIVFRAGYRGNAFLAVELLGEVLPGFDASDAVKNDVSGYAVTFNTKLLLPLGRVEPWVMVGLGFLDINADRYRGDRDDLAFRPAAGVDLHLTPHWALYAEAAYMLPTGSVERFDYATFGGGLLFGF